MDSTFSFQHFAIKEIEQSIDRLFVRLLWVHFAAALLLAFWFQTFVPALLIGLPSTVIVSWLARIRPGTPIVRNTAGIALMVYSALYIQQTHGLTEMHFHVFCALAFLLAYRDWKTIVVASAIISIHHICFAMLQTMHVPVYVYATNTVGPLVLTLIHAAFVMFEAAILVKVAIDMRQEWERAQMLSTYHSNMAGVATAIAGGDLTQHIVSKSDADVLGHAFNRMIGNLRLLIETITDKSTALQKSEERYRSVVEQIKEIIFTTDTAGHWTFLNSAWTTITGFSIEESLGRSLLHFVAEDDRPLIMALCEALLRQEKDYGCQEIRFRTRDQGICWAEVQIQGMLDPQGELTGFFGTLSDITERKKAETQLLHLGLHDTLTDLPNRLLFQDRLRSALGRLQRRQTGVAVLFLDLDNFKYVNDSMGHEAGDTLLKTIATRLQTVTRTVDTVARLGGDEFTVLLDEVHNVGEAVEVAERIIGLLRTPIALGDRQVFASVSIGIAFTVDTAASPDDVLRDADMAMYQAKSNDKSGYAVFDASMHASAVERMEIETGLRFALERGELRVHYQPLFDLETGLMSGVEALVRWQHPTYGLMPPGKFIPIAEDSGLILPIGYWVLEEACRQHQAWRAATPDQSKFIMNVNLSGKQLIRKDVVERVREIVERTGIAAHDLKLEITESVMMADVQDTVGKLMQLRTLGVQLAMDDFGTGYSSMASLNLFPLDTVKIDRSFISRLEDSDDARSVIAAIIMLSRSMNFNVTGEGVETEAQVTFLQGLGCHIGQGYYFGKPVAAEALDAAVTTRENPRIRNAYDANRQWIEALLDAA